MVHLPHDRFKQETYPYSFQPFVCDHPSMSFFLSRQPRPIHSSETVAVLSFSYPYVELTHVSDYWSLYGSRWPLSCPPLVGALPPLHETENRVTVRRNRETIKEGVWSLKVSPSYIGYCQLCVYENPHHLLNFYVIDGIDTSGQLIK